MGLILRLFTTLDGTRRSDRDVGAPDTTDEEPRINMSSIPYIHTTHSMLSSALLLQAALISIES